MSSYWCLLGSRLHSTNFSVRIKLNTAFYTSCPSQTLLRKCVQYCCANHPFEPKEHRKMFGGHSPSRGQCNSIIGPHLLAMLRSAILWGKECIGRCQLQLQYPLRICMAKHAPTNQHTSLMLTAQLFAIGDSQNVEHLIVDKPASSIHYVLQGAKTKPVTYRRISAASCWLFVLVLQWLPNALCTVQPMRQPWQ